MPKNMKNLLGKSSNLLGGERAADLGYMYKGAPLASQTGAGRQRAAIAGELATTSSPNVNAAISRSLNVPSVTQPAKTAAAPPPAAKSTETAPPPPTLKGYQAPVSGPYTGGSLKL